MDKKSFQAPQSGMIRSASSYFDPKKIRNLYSSVSRNYKNKKESRNESPKDNMTEMVLLFILKSHYFYNRINLKMRL